MEHGFRILQKTAFLIWLQIFVISLLKNGKKLLYRCHCRGVFSTFHPGVKDEKICGASVHVV